MRGSTDFPGGNESEAIAPGAMSPLAGYAVIAFCRLLINSRAVAGYLTGVRKLMVRPSWNGKEKIAHYLHGDTVRLVVILGRLRFLRSVESIEPVQRIEFVRLSSLSML